MSAPVRRFRLSSIFRWALLVLAGGMPAPAHGTTLELGAPPSAAVVVSGPLGCPDAAAVGAALKGLLPPRQTGEGAGDGPDVLQLSPRRDGLDVRLYAPGGALVGEKSLVTDEACDERAQTVAVLVAAWETRWRAGSPSALPRPSPAAAAEAPRPPSPRLATPVPPVPTDPPGALVETVTTQHQAVPLRIEMRAGLLMSIAGGSVAPALSCDLAFRRRGLPFALAVGALVVGNHDVPVGPASARWRRVGGTVEVRSAMERPKVVLEMHAAVALSALSVSGAALPVTSGTTLFDPGLLVGLRGQLRAVSLSPWIEATAALWPDTHVVYLKGGPDERDLPAFEVFLGAGVAFGAGL